MGPGPKSAVANRLASTAPASFAQSTPLISGGDRSQHQQQAGEASSMAVSSRPFSGLKGAPQRPAAAAAPVQSKNSGSVGRGHTVDDDHKTLAAALPPSLPFSQSTGHMGRAGGGGGGGGGGVGGASGVGAAPQRIQKPAAPSSGCAPSAAAAEEEISSQLHILTITATTWSQRESALLSLNDLLLKRPPSSLQVERTVDAVSERLADPHPRAACACMVVLHSLLQLAPVPLTPRIDILLPRVFARASEVKPAAAAASGCPQEAAFSWLAAVRDVVPADVLLL